MTPDLYTYQINYDFPHKHLLKLADYAKEDVYSVLALALKLKKDRASGAEEKVLCGKTLGMIFTKSSTRTRVSFEAGIYQLGGIGMFLSSADIQLGRNETIQDTAGVLSRYIDGIMIRTFAHKDVEDLAAYGSIPIINGLTDDYHPCQVLADLQTIYEKKGTFEGLKLAYVGDGNNMANSLMTGCAMLGMDVAIASPSGYEPKEAFVTESARVKAEGSKILITNSIEDAVAGADIVYGDVWASMGMEAEAAERLQRFDGYQVNDKVFALAKPDCIYMHCLPAHRGEEVTASVIDGPHSVIYDEAENRLHAQKAVMVLLMGGKK